MTEIGVADAAGHRVHMIDFGEYRSSFFGRSLDYIIDVNNSLPHFRFRHDDVLLVSYPKTGCTWTFEILNMLLKGKPEGATVSKMDHMLEACNPDLLDSIPSPRILNTHLQHRRMPADLANKQVKIVFVTRNPKDTAISLYNMMFGMKHFNYAGKFSDWLPLFLKGALNYDSFPRYHMDWEKAYNSKQHNMLLVYFEDMKRDCLHEVKRIAAFLDVHLAEDTLRAISEQCQFEQMKSRYTDKMLGTSSYRDEAKYGFMRKGEVGNWKEWFTVAENELFDDVIRKEMDGTQLNFAYQLD